VTRPVARWAGTVVVALWLAAGPAAAQSDVSPRAYRLFLVDGTEVATHGEPSRVGDDVVAMVPLGQDEQDGQSLLPVTLPAEAIDWARTDAYLRSVRLALYRATDSDRDFAAFSADIAATLDRVADTPDPLARIAMVEGVRRRLAAWPEEHYGDKQEEAAQMLSVLDDILVGLRAAAGQREFTLAITSGSASPAPALPPPPLRPAPSLQEIVMQALAVAPHVRSAREREALLTRTLSIVKRGDPAWEGNWRRRVERTLEKQLDDERRTSRAYASLRQRVIARANELAASADVRALLDLRHDAVRRDERLGGRRPAEMTALLAHLDGQLAAARTLRLALDRWEARRPILEAYRRAMLEVFASADPVLAALDDVRTLSGPPLAELERASAVLKGIDVMSRRLDAPDEGRSLPGLLASAVQMADMALARRRAATEAASLPQAWEASAAAAGALLVFDRLRQELAALVQPPTLATAGAGAPR
jgi:hypothetical protein